MHVYRKLQIIHKLTTHLCVSFHSITSSHSFASSFSYLFFLVLFHSSFCMYSVQITYIRLHWVTKRKEGNKQSKCDTFDWHWWATKTKSNNLLPKSITRLKIIEHRLESNRTEPNGIEHQYLNIVHEMTFFFRGALRCYFSVFHKVLIY